jgi:hypothetical protein
VRTLAEQYYQWEQGALDSGIWEGMKGLLDDFAQYPGFRMYCGLRRHQFSEGFQAYVDAAISRAPTVSRPMFL